MPLLALLLLLVLLPAAAAADGPLERFAYARAHLGTRVRIVLYAPDEATADEAAEAAYDRVIELNAILSDYSSSSEVSRLSTEAVTAPVAISHELWTVLEMADRLWRASDGAFDAAIGPVVALWREARRSGVLPSAEARAAALARSGWQHVTLDPLARTVQLGREGMKLDLGGLAKGYIGDEVIATLTARGFPHCLFEAGGDTVLGAPPPGEAGWSIAFTDGTSRELSYCGVAASGDTAQYVVIGGRRYSHVVDPRTDLGLTSRRLSHVIAPRGLESDGLATAVGVLDAAAGRALLAAWPGAQGWVHTVTDPPQPDLRPRRLGERGLF
mgnify:CR=1 FL=1